MSTGHHRCYVSVFSTQFVVNVKVNQMPHLRTIVVYVDICNWPGSTIAQTISQYYCKNICKILWVFFTMSLPGLRSKGAQKKQKLFLGLLFICDWTFSKKNPFICKMLAHKILIIPYSFCNKTYFVWASRFHFRLLKSMEYLSEGQYRVF